ncbi:MAG: heparan-alpha-glucosaminide N-acetyltransferase domain-containing protein [Oscillospiraceae bacterium]|nr:heparan-alpha-glucosaminide N-acetyltransferase domain-containing protein [Oscillospiraceae bacterium]
MATQRNPAIDRFRGLAVIGMVLVDSLLDTPAIPAWLKHPEDVGFTLADIVAPMFLFAIAATYRQSFLRRAEKGGAYAHFFSRYLAIVGLGTIFSGGGIAFNWGVLQAIGVAGLITLLVIKLPALARAGIGLGLLAAYQLVSNLVPAVREMIFEGDHGSIIGSLSWGALLIIATAMIDFYNKGLKPFLLGTGILSALAAGSLFLVPLSKERVSASYVLVSLAICCVLYLAVNAVSGKLPWKSGIVTWWGENPLLMFLLQLIFVGISKAVFSDHKLLWQGLVTSAAMLAAMSLIAWALHRKGKRFAL